METTRPSKSAINAIILDYLVTSGFAGAAEKFIQESNLSDGRTVDLARIRDRVRVRDLILCGKVEEATEALNDVDPQVLDSNPSLHFHMLQLQLIEIIRAVLNNGEPSPTDFQPALKFASQQLAPHAPRDPAHLEALEQTMALLIYKPDKMSPDMKSLLDERLRERVADEVNQALLTANGLPPQARIRELVRARAWAEAKAREANIDLGDTDIGLSVAGSDHAMMT